MSENLDEAGSPPQKSKIAGIEAAEDKLEVSVPEELGEDNSGTFVAHSLGLREMVLFLKKHGIEEAALEASGVFWVPVYNILDNNGIKPVLLNTRRLKILPGERKRLGESRWILAAYSLDRGRGCRVPEKDVEVLRELVRAREYHVQAAANLTSVMIRELRLMSVNLEKAVPDLHGELSMKIMAAIAGGERDPNVLAAIRFSTQKKSRDKISRHLQGAYADHRVFNFKMYFENYEKTKGTIKMFDDKILESLESLGSDEPPGGRE